MLDAWIDQFDALDIPVEPAALTRVLALANKLQARIATTVASFDVRGEWELDGSTSMIAWLKGRGLGAGEAAQLTMTGRRTRALPCLAAAWTAGRLSSGQVKAILGCIREAHVSVFAEHEAALIPSLEHLNAHDTHIAMTEWRLKAEALDDLKPGKQKTAEAHLSQTLDGRWYLNGAFDAEPGAIIDTAIRLASSADWNLIPAERRGDALVDVCRWFLDNQHTNTAKRHRPHLNVVVDGDTLNGTGHVTGCLAETRLPLDSPTMTRLLCDCTLHRVLRDSAGTIIDYGKATRSIPAPLYNALVVRDRHCRFDTCDRPPTWCEGHHVHWYSNGGPTNLKNLVLLCSRHHHMLHKPGWRAVLQPDGGLHVTSPYGDWTTHPPGQRQPAAH